MKRSFPPPAREALFALIGAIVCGAACEPNNGVKPGKPELIELTIVQPNPPGSFPALSATTVKPDTPTCVDPIKSGDACLPMGHAADAVDGGTFTMDVPADGLCRDAVAMNWCTCVPDGMDPAAGAWSCEAFTNVMAVVAVFDRLLDTSPFDAADAGPVMDSVVTTTASVGAPVVHLLTDYSPTGDSKGFVFNLFGPFYGNFRADGPSLYSAPQPEFPSDSTITVTVEATKVHAKDGTTPFTATGPLASGTLLFTMAPFAAALSPPDPTSTLDPTAALVTFTNFVDTPGCFTDDDPMTDPDPACMTAAHITATAGGTTIATNISSPDGAHLLVAPKGGAWPAGAMVTIAVDDKTTNLVSQTIAAAPAPLTFTAP